METSATYLSKPQTLTLQQIHSSKDWILQALDGWKRAFKPDPVDSLCMAVALEEIAGTLRSEAAAKPYAESTQT